MGLNDDELTPREHQHIREVLLSGAHTVKPVGTHRTQLIAGALAILLVAGVTGGAIAAASNLGADGAPVTSTPSPTPSISRTPAPSPTPTVAPDISAPVAVEGDCALLLSAEEANEILGVTAEVRHPLSIDDPSLIGGVTCTWSAVDDTYPYLYVAAYPTAVVPADIRAKAGVVPDCLGGDECAYSAVYGDAWVVAYGGDADRAVRAVELAGPRAQSEPGVPAALPAGSWLLPVCEDLRAVVAAHLSRDDLGPYQGDANPSGVEYDLEAANGLRSWCGSNGSPPAENPQNRLELIEIDVGPGSRGASADAISSAGLVAVDVPGATAAWIGPLSSESTVIVAATDRNAIRVSAHFLDPETLASLTGALIAHLDASVR